MKLTQGTSRGTCWWNNLLEMAEIIFNFLEDFFINDFITIIFLFFIFKFLFINIFLEIIWISFYFNNKFLFINIKKKKFIEIFFKLNIFL